MIEVRDTLGRFKAACFIRPMRTLMTLKFLPLLARGFGLGVLLLLSACATLDGPTDPEDPFERYNRGMYAFNDAVDRAVLKPVAEGYVQHVPTPVRSGVNNFFSNLDDVVVLLNDLLQFKLQQAASDFGRILVNSTVGIYGLFDFASSAGLPKHNEDFGQTLGHWGVASGPYVVLPLLGPSSVRDGSGWLVDYRYTDPATQGLDDQATENVLFATETINTRAGLLNASSLLDTAALDPYIFTRDAFLQRRESLVYDGNPPEEDFEDFDDDSFY